MRFRLLLALPPLLLLAACDSAEPSQVDLLTAAAWVPRTPDAVPLSSPAQYEFRDDGTLLLTLHDGGTEEETWEFQEQEYGSVLIVRDGGSFRRFSVLRLTSENLALDELPGTLSSGPRHYELVHP